MNTNFKVIGLTRLGIKPESTAKETDALYHSAKDAFLKLRCFSQTQALNFTYIPGNRVAKKDKGLSDPCLANHAKKKNYC